MTSPVMSNAVMIARIFEFIQIHS